MGRSAKRKVSLGTRILRMRMKLRMKFTQETAEEYAIRLAKAREGYYKRKSMETPLQKEIRLALSRTRYLNARKQKLKRKKDLPKFEYVELQTGSNTEFEKEGLALADEHSHRIRKRRCSVPLCLNYKTEDISLHEFPRDAELENQWRAALRINNKCIKHMRVCSAHFLPDDYNKFKSKDSTKRILKKRRIPSQNLPNIPYQPYKSNQITTEAEPVLEGRHFLDTTSSEPILEEQIFLDTTITESVTEENVLEEYPEVKVKIEEGFNEMECPENETVIDTYLEDKLEFFKQEVKEEYNKNEL